MLSQLMQLVYKSGVRGEGEGGWKVNKVCEK